MGCIGTLSAARPLVITVADRARAAALTDPRVGPVRPRDLADLDVSVSVLSPLEPMAVAGYDQLVAALRPFVDGVVIDSDRSRATFLPSVWETLPEPAAFVAALWLKAGIPQWTWPRGAHPSRYTAQHRSNRERASGALHDSRR
jgi:AmmeMemoRadiSam system protein A